MFDLGINPFHLGFLLLPPMTALCLQRQKSMWLLIAMAVAVSLLMWGLLVYGEFWFEEQLFQSMTDEQRQTYSDSVVGKVEALFFGFPTSLVYTSIWVIGTRLASVFWERFSLSSLKER